MMYTLRAILVSCSVLFLVYLLASAVLACLSKPLARWLRADSAEQAAELIFALRLSPLLIALAAASLLTLPAFFRFEPAASSESVGVLPIVCSAALLLAFAIASGRAWRAYSRTQAWIDRCMAATAKLENNGDVAVVFAPEAAPVALAGLRRSQVLISATACASLTAAELRCTIAHEFAHARSRDNLKKLFLHACAFTGLGALERAWLESIEFAADCAAVKSEADAVELASALVKLSRLPSGAPPAIVTCLTEGPTPLLAARVERLLARGEVVKTGRASSRPLIVGLCALLLPIACNYGTLLHAAHELTELLVRA
jgi:peptidase M48-like protein